MFLDDTIGCSKKEAKMETPLRLAYIGDAIYETMVREFLLKKGTKTVHGLHRAAIDFVSAKGQAGFLQAIAHQLDEDEQEIVRRGRNAKSATVPKNANVLDYRNATALEALFGYHYIQGNSQRIRILFEEIIKLSKGDAETKSG